jgi:hypothetical protein
LSCEEHNVHRLKYFLEAGCRSESYIYIYIGYNVVIGGLMSMSTQNIFPSSHLDEFCAILKHWQILLSSDIIKDGILYSILK